MTSTLIQTRKQLDVIEADLDAFMRIECQFWACKGPMISQHMITCVRCDRIYQLLRLAVNARQRMGLSQEIFT